MNFELVLQFATIFVITSYSIHYTKLYDILYNYIIDTKLYLSNDKIISDKIKNLCQIYPDESFLKCVYNYIEKDKTNFLFSLDNFLKNENITENQIFSVKTLSIKLGLRRDFYNKVKLVKDRNQISDFYASYNFV